MAPRSIPFAAVAILTGLADGVLAQSVVRGSVVAGTTDRPVAGVLVRLEGPGTRSVRTGPGGAFLVDQLPAGRVTLSFRAVGFEPITAEAELSGRDTLELEIRLEQAVQRLEPIAVGGKATPERRKQSLITAAEIEPVLAVAADGYEVVARLRPSYLRGRGASDLGKPHIPEVGRPGPRDDATSASSASGVPDRVLAARMTAAARSARLHLPKVTIDDGPLLDLEMLRSVPARTIAEIRMMSSIEAATRYGTAVEGGVITVTLKGFDRTP